MISFIKTPKALTIVIGGKTFNIASTHPSYDEICEELKRGKDANEQTVLELIDVVKALNGKTFGKVTVTDDKVYYGNRPVGNALSKKIIEMLRDGYDVTPWALFMDNVYKNPADYAREELYLFLESGNLPLTPDGHFLAFKNVRKDMTSHHDGKTLHVIGKPLEMPREKVDKDRHQTCSYGLHFCSQSYLKEFHPENSVTLILKINPADVVSIPSDYSNTKGRTWRYVPIAILGEDESVHDTQFEKPVVGKLKSGVEVFEDDPVIEKAVKAKPEANKGTKINNMAPSKFLKAVTAAGGARPYARDNGLAKSTVQDWVKKARDVLGV